MQNVILVIHLILALLLIGAVLLQRSEGGALGMGGGGDFMSGRGVATALQKATWGLIAAFVGTSLFLTILATQDARDRGLLDDGSPRIDGAPAIDPENLTPQLPGLEEGGGLGEFIPGAEGGLTPSLPAPAGGGIEEEAENNGAAPEADEILGLEEPDPAARQ